MDKETKYVLNELIMQVYNIRQDLSNLYLSCNYLQERVLKLDNPSIVEQVKGQINMNNDQLAKVTDQSTAALLELQRIVND